MAGQVESTTSQLVEVSTDLSIRELEVCTLNLPGGEQPAPEDGPLARMKRRPSIVIVDYENEEII